MMLILCFLIILIFCKGIILLYPTHTHILIQIPNPKIEEMNFAAFTFFSLTLLSLSLSFLTDCDNVAGLSTKYIADKFLTASTSLNDINNIANVRARPWVPSATGWIPGFDDTRPWLEVRFTKAFDIKAIVTQGCSNEDFWVKSFSIDFSLGDTDLVTIVDGAAEKTKVGIPIRKRK